MDASIIRCKAGRIEQEPSPLICDDEKGCIFSSAMFKQNQRQWTMYKAVIFNETKSSELQKILLTSNSRYRWDKVQNLTAQWGGLTRPCFFSETNEQILTNLVMDI
jgi:hypothetical protein